MKQDELLGPRGGKVVDTKQLSPKHKTAIRLYCTGLSVQEVSEAVGVSQTRIYSLLQSSCGSSYRDRVFQELDEAFQNLYSRVVNSIRECLDGPDVGLRLAAAALWLKTQKEQKIRVELTAEDVVQKMLNMGVQAQDTKLINDEHWRE